MATHSSSCLAFSSFLLRLAFAALIWCHASLVATAQQVRIGVILNMASPVWPRWRVGIKMAVEDYYAARPGSAARVALRFRDSGGDVIGAASAGKARSLRASL
jgi:glutamate receptor, ionotropic, plant